MAHLTKSTADRQIMNYPNLTIPGQSYASFQATVCKLKKKNKKNHSFFHMQNLEMNTVNGLLT